MSSNKLKPLIGQRAVVELYIPDLNDNDLGEHVKQVIFKGFINNGYAIRVQIKNANFALLAGLFEGSGSGEFLELIRNGPVEIRLKIKQSPGTGTDWPRESTRTIKAYITTLYPHGSGEIDYVDIVAIDPLNYFMRVNEGWGGAFEGGLDSAMRQLIIRYAPQISNKHLIIAGSIKNAGKVWWMMRRSPRDMLSHLIHMSTAFSESLTPWVIGVDAPKDGSVGEQIKIGPLTTFKSNPIGYYHKMDENGYGDILDWEAILNPSLGHYEMGLVTAGTDARLGVSYDPSMATNGTHSSIITDSNTTKKYVPANSSSKALKSTRRPPDATFKAGMFGRSYVDSPPEYIANDITEPYANYYNTYARTQYMQHIHKLMTIELKVKGHGAYDNTVGLGANTVYIDWQNNFKNKVRQYFLAGNWIVYGFKHVWYENDWTTTVMLSKTDVNAQGTPVGM